MKRLVAIVVVTLFALVWISGRLQQSDEERPLQVRESDSGHDEGAPNPPAPRTVFATHETLEVRRSIIEEAFALGVLDHWEWTDDGKTPFIFVGRGFTELTMGEKRGLLATCAGMVFKVPAGGYLIDGEKLYVVDAYTEKLLGDVDYEGYHEYQWPMAIR